ncbi:MAG TPA: alpha/beta hydrolase [Nevskiaceae bacterium]|nr:alpha/beta hydrolase [Nevskiaceae bacterium]
MSELIDLRVGGRPLTIEYSSVGNLAAHAPWLVILHEGLGSVALWKDFPARLCEACGVRGLVYSRPGYGRSTPRPHSEHWAPDFMHRQASEVLPALLDALHAPPRYGLFGHSDGASIALIHAAKFPDRTAAAMVLAPHILVEEQSIASIAEARKAYLNTSLRDKLAHYHADVDSAFWGWNDAWLNPAFHNWSIQALLPDIRCPVLAVQGEKDAYGTMAQVDGIAAALPARQCQLLRLKDCGHSAHLDQPQAVITAARSFFARALQPTPAAVAP